MNRNSFLFYAPILIVAAAILLKFFNYYAYSHFVKEDGIAEYGTAIFYLAGGFIGIRICNRIRKWGAAYRLLLACYIFLTAFLFFVGMEELSWGQRIFKIPTPDAVEAVNLKSEINVHNIKYVHGYVVLNGFIIICLFGALAWRYLPEKIFGYKKLFFAPDKSISLFFVPNLLASVYFWLLEERLQKFLGPEKFKMLEFINAEDAEFTEFVLSIGFILFAWQVLQYVKTAQPEMEKQIA